MANEDIFSMLKAGLKATSKITKDRIVHTKKDEVSKKLVQVNQIVAGTRFDYRWKIHGTHLICNIPKQINFERYKFVKDNQDLVKIAAFDLDGTLVETKSNLKFARGPNDWKWWTSKSLTLLNVVEKLKQLADDRYIVVIFTNQGGVIATNTSKSYLSFTGRMNSIMKELPDEQKSEVFVYASPKKPSSKSMKVPISSDSDHLMMRKPNIGMWEVLTKYFEGKHYKIDRESSFFVGDAAGRLGDFLDSDKMFAKNAQIQFKVPEDIF